MSGTFGPLVHRVFRWLWIASFASNLGTAMHGVGAAWLMTSLTTSAATVALLTTAAAVPTFLLALPAGALTDVLDRRKLLLAAQVFMMACAAVLAVIAATGGATPAILLGFTFALGVGTALNQPAWSAIVPELVPRADLPQALVLNGMAFTGAMAIGPALGGAVVAAAGAEAVFGLNAISFVGQIVVIYLWRREPSDHHLPAEHVVSAMRAGLRYLRFAPGLSVVLIRAGAYVACMTAGFALLPAIGRGELKLGPGGYGLLLGCMGLGAVTSAFVLPRVRRAASIDVLAIVGTLLVVCLLLGLAVVRRVEVIAALMLVAGAGQMVVMSSLNVAAQSVLPSWVRGRGLALYQLVFQLATAVGAILWGALASTSGIRLTLLIAAGALAATVLLRIWFPLAAVTERDLTPIRWPQPDIVVAPDPADGPVLVTSEYRIAPEDAEAFAVAMRALRRARRRDGAVRWAVWYDLHEPSRHVESYIVPSWGEHLRQRERATTADGEVWRRARSFHAGEGEDGVVVRWHLIRRPSQR